MDYNRTTLPNGLRIITQDMTSVRSVSIGMWVDTGSRDETPIEAGASHFLEHLLFKGSQDMSAHYISEALDGVGARHNAFTSKEYTCYWARARDADLPLALNILSEMLQRPAFRQAEIDSERHVVLEEINMNQDDPADVAHEIFMRAMWQDHPISPPILGTKESITEMTRATIADYWARRYSPHSIVVSAAGRIDHDELVDQVQALLGGWEGSAGDRPRTKPVPGTRIDITTRDTEQAHLVFGGLGLARDDERRWAHTVADHVLGGGMSSRLFREIREERGLAYAVQSFRMGFLEAGAVGVYVGTTPTQAPEVLELVRSEFAKIIGKGITDDELQRAKGFVKGSLVLSLEDSSSRMNRLGRNEITGLEHLSIDEVVSYVDAVELDDVQEIGAALYAGPFVLGAVGPFDVADLEEFVS
jgi:predicted Zn-dependent peptidase